jgi:hypothetical protein
MYECKINKDRTNMKYGTGNARHQLQTLLRLFRSCDKCPARCKCFKMADTWYHSSKFVASMKITAMDDTEPSHTLKNVTPLTDSKSLLLTAGKGFFSLTNGDSRCSLSTFLFVCPHLWKASFALTYEDK